MAEVTGGFMGFFVSTYDKILAAFSGDGSLAVQVLIFSVVLAVVSLFIWEFYKSTSKRNLIKLNLSKYNVSDHPLTSKFLATMLYLLEYMIIMPLLILLWYAGLSIVLLLVASGRTVDQILLLAGVVIGAIRILAYFKGEISKDLAKLFPFIALSLFILTPGTFAFSELTNRIGEIPSLLSNIFSFIVVIIAIEIVLRIFYTMYEFWKSEEEADDGDVPVPSEK